MGSSGKKFNTGWAERLEAGELLSLESCPFMSPASETAAFFRTQQTRAPSLEAISYDPSTGKLHGQTTTNPEETERLAGLLRSFSDAATGWLANQLPEYAGKWTRDRATLRPAEEALRTPHPQERNDLLHVDQFERRPSAGRRILRLFVNINPTESRVWITSEGFKSLLERFQRRYRIPARSASEWSEPLTGLQRLMQRDWTGRPAYDSFMLNLQRFLKSDDAFQDKAAKHLWNFAPGSAWLLFADGLSHAVLRGQYALEHSFFVPQEALVLPERSPLQQLIAAGETPVLRKAG